MTDGRAQHMPADKRARRGPPTSQRCIGESGRLATNLLRRARQEEHDYQRHLSSRGPPESTRHLAASASLEVGFFE